jgi:hypothetical protein
MLHFDPLGEVFHCYNSESVISLCWCEIANDVDAPPLQRSRWGGRLGAMREFLAGFIS